MGKASKSNSRPQGISKTSIKQSTKSNRTRRGKIAELNANSQALASSSATPDVPSQEDAGTGAIFFWREYGSEHAYLSQWYKSPFSTDDDPSITYQDAEMYMMYQKAILFNDHEIAALILEQTSPKEIKQLGRQVKNFTNEEWNANRLRIVTEGSYYKFKNGRAEGEDTAEKGEDEKKVGVLKARLLSTGDRELVEASPMDRIWGVGFGAKNAEKGRAKWGLNLLGKALTEARRRLREEEEAALP